MSQYVRLGTITLKDACEKILEQWENSGEPDSPKWEGPKWSVQGYEVGVGSTRLKTFARHYQNHNGTIACVNCGLQASFFSIDNLARNPQGSPHINLFGVGPDGNEVLFTHDHTVARVFGGADDLGNTRVMCSPCNSRKGTKEGKLAQQLGLKRNDRKTKKQKAPENM